MTPLHLHLAKFLQQHPAKRLGVAVSGGSDSMALLRLLAGIHPTDRLFAATIDHGLRPEAAQEARLVAETCASLNIAHQIMAWRDRPETGNVMDKARRARSTLLAAWAQDLSLDGVALGHTQDDVAETFLMRLGRAAGVEGLAAMPAQKSAHGVTWLRPLLEIPRSELRKYCRDIGQTWVDDPTNDDPDYARTRMRQALVALSQAGLEPAQIAASARHLAATRDTLARELVAKTRAHTRQVDGDIVISRAAFDTLDTEFQRLWLRGAFVWMGQTDYPPRGVAVADVARAIGEGRKTTLAGCVIWTQAGHLRLTRELSSLEGVAAPAGAVWDNQWRLEGPEFPPNSEIRALGEAGLLQIKAWRDTGRARPALLVSPALWAGDQLICAPLAETAPKWRAKNVKNLSDFISSLLSR